MLFILLLSDLHKQSVGRQDVLVDRYLYTLIGTALVLGVNKACTYYNQNLQRQEVTQQMQQQIERDGRIVHNTLKVTFRGSKASLKKLQNFYQKQQQKNEQLQSVINSHQHSIEQ